MEAERFDMGRGGKMTQAEIDAKFEAKVRKEKGVMAQFLIEMSNEDLRRSVMKMDLNEPAEEEVDAAKAEIRRRVRLGTDDSNSAEKFDETVESVRKAAAKFGGKIIAFHVAATVIDSSGTVPVEKTLTTIAGTVVSSGKVLHSAVNGHIDALARELKLPWEEALQVFTSTIRSLRYSNKLAKTMEARSALKIIEERREAPEDDPAMAVALSAAIHGIEDEVSDRNLGEVLSGLVKLRDSLEKAKKKEEGRGPGEEEPCND